MKSSRVADEGGAVGGSRDLSLGHLEPATFLISCGGTGGHLAPGIALAEELISRGHEATLLISEKKVDVQLAAKYPQLRFQRLPGAPFSWRPAAAVKFSVQQARGFRVARELVRQQRPAAIVGFGGFTSAAVMLVGRLTHVPIVLHEANRVPGRAIRAMARFAQRIFLPPGVDTSSSWRARVRPVGVPVRREIRLELRESARTAFGLDPSRPVVAVLGGSQGAQALNAWARDVAPELAAAGGQLLCVTGAAGGAVAADPAHAGVSAAMFIPFCDRMATLLSAADLVVSRAGAGTIAELIRCRTPSVLVPYPFAADNHQAANAEWLAAQGGALVVRQTEPERLTAEVRSLLAEPARREAMRLALAKLDQGDPGRMMADELEALVAVTRPVAARPVGRPVTG